MSDEPAAAGDSARVPDRRVLLGAGLVASLLLGGGAFLLVGGDEPVDEVVFAVPRRAAVAVAPATPSPTPTDAAAGRHAEPTNPFLAQVREAPASQPAPGEMPAGGDPVVGAPDPVPELPDPVPELPDPVPELPGDQPGDGLPTTPATVPAEPPSTPSAGPSPTDPVSTHTLVLTQVTGTPPDLRGRFLVDGEAVTVAAGDDQLRSFGPDAVLTLLGLEQTSAGWTAVVQIGTATPVNLPAGTVLRFG